MKKEIKKGNNKMKIYRKNNKIEFSSRANAEKVFESRILYTKLHIIVNFYDCEETFTMMNELDAIKAEAFLTELTNF
jgi:hypothetical protein